MDATAAEAEAHAADAATTCNALEASVLTHVLETCRADEAVEAVPPMKEIWFSRTLTKTPADEVVLAESEAAAAAEPAAEPAEPAEPAQEDAAPAVAPKVPAEKENAPAPAAAASKKPSMAAMRADFASKVATKAATKAAAPAARKFGDALTNK